jgi:hypothetical protein
MSGLRSRGVAALVLIVSLTGCSSAGGQASRRLADTAPHPERGDRSGPATVAMPALLANVPADTPYLLASVEEAPAEFWNEMALRFAPLVDAIRARFDQELGRDKISQAIAAELAGKWNPAGIESLGFSTDPRFAIYGLGLQPLVVRIAVKDHRRVRAAIERIAARSGAPLPALASKDGRSYWQHTNPNGSRVVVALADNQAILAVGDPAGIEANLGLILGSEKPASAMTDGRLLRQLMAQHGFGGQLIGLVDTRQLTRRVIELAGGAPGPTCTGAIDRLSAKLPRAVFGYGELSAAKASLGLVLELTPDGVAALRSLKTRVPGLAAAMSGQPMIALASAIDLLRARSLGAAVYDQLHRLGSACQLADLTDSSARVAALLGKPAADPESDIVGVALAIDEVVFAGEYTPGEKPQRFEGLALLASSDARALFGKIVERVPPLARFRLVHDSKLHDLAVAAAPYPMAMGIGERAIVVSAGTKRREDAERLLAARGAERAPLLAVTLDLHRLLELGIRNNREGFVYKNDEVKLATFNGLRAIVGRAWGSLDVTDRGLALWTTFELR